MACSRSSSRHQLVAGKVAFDPDQKIFAIKNPPRRHVRPLRFRLSTTDYGTYGDPIDVLLLMDEPAFPGCAVPARLIGVIEGEQIDGKKRIRNDRLVAVTH